jgi:hypothetical protein
MDTIAAVFGAVRDLFETGLGVDIALGFIALEFVYLLARANAESRKAKVRELVLALGPGICLMLAVRCAITGADALWIAFWLAASLPLHLADGVRRKL